MLFTETDDVEGNGPLQVPSEIPTERLAPPIFSEKLSNLSDECCVHITTVTKKKDIAQNLHNAYAAALTGHSPDNDDLKKIKVLHDL
ncbi:hypothetical protein CEXT_777491 [Caerostris extrusa]|uniref:Uncharacterized protein n=1 Tax=Caerostris extrusa TaxID=172846 RepID=A0AAV4YCE6_CAEEX|nr:hypothetical protein CEXT_777491 [Caerostris extrusa]